MAATTGPVLVMGGITIFNKTVLNHQPLDFKIPIATGFVAMGFALFEKFNAKMATGVAWIAVITVLFARVDPKTPSPAETLMKLWGMK